MTTFILWIRFLLGVCFLIFSFFFYFKEGLANAALASIAIGFALVCNPKGKVRGQVNLLATHITFKKLMTWPVILSGIRWFIGFIYVSGALGAFLQKTESVAYAMLSMGLVWISPLDRLFFPNIRTGPDKEAKDLGVGIIGVRNIGVILHTIAIGLFIDKHYLWGNILLWVALILICLMAITVTDSIIIPRPASPSFGLSLVKSSPLAWDLNKPMAKTNVAEPEPSIEVAQQKEVVVKKHIEAPPAPAPAPAKEKKLRYITAYKLGFTATLNISEQKFNNWVRQFQSNWLEANKYQHRLSIHRNPNLFKNQVIQELNDYIQEIRDRQEMSVEQKGKIYCVPDLIDDAFMGDKQVRSLFSALTKYCSQPNAKPLVIIGAHIAEYRAMINLVKRIKQSQLADARKRLAQSNHTAPAISAEQLASINDETYFKIVDYIILLGKNLENYTELNKNFDEELYRDYFLAPLNTMSPHYGAKGEVFNRKGKTDILVFDTKGNNIFIAECKCWKGTAYLIGGVDQLLNSYVNWRDEKAAIIVFNKTTKKFTELIRTATEALAGHPLCIRPGEKRTDASWSFWFRHPDDEQRSIRLELILFNFA
jgi:hypothetical protein